MTFYFCDYDAGPCVVSERALERSKRDPARCVAHGAIIGGILRDCTDRAAARRKLGVPFRKLYAPRGSLAQACPRCGVAMCDPHEDSCTFTRQ